jgi:circadian clock protein KaiB
MANGKRQAGKGSTPEAPTDKSADTGQHPPIQYLLRLYVTGPSSVSARAVVNARRICEAHLQGRYQLEILNVADNVAMATKDQIVAAPTLIKLAPLPLKRFIGDMSNTERLIQGLDVGKPITH